MITPAMSYALAAFIAASVVGNILCLYLLYLSWRKNLKLAHIAREAQWKIESVVEQRQAMETRYRHTIGVIKKAKGKSMMTLNLESETYTVKHVPKKNQGRRRDDP